MKVYRLKDKANGHFSTGGFRKNSAFWSTKGKIWNGSGPIRQNLAMHLERDFEAGPRVYKLCIPESWVVVENDLDTGDQIEYNAKEFYLSSKDVQIRLKRYTIL